MNEKFLYITKSYFAIMAISGAVMLYKTHVNIKEFKETKMETNRTMNLNI